PGDGPRRTAAPPAAPRRPLGRGPGPAPRARRAAPPHARRRENAAPARAASRRPRGRASSGPRPRWGVRCERAPRAHAAPAGSDRPDPRSGPPPPRRRAPPPCAGLPRTGLRPPRPPASARRRAPPCGGGRRGAATRRDRGSRSFSWRRGFYATGPPRSRRAPRAAISPQQILDLLEEAAPARMHLLARLAREFFEQLALALGQRGRRLHDHAHPLIAAGAVAVQRGDALAPQAEDLAALRAGRDDHLDLAVEGGHLHRGAECGLGEA